MSAPTGVAQPGYRGGAEGSRVVLGFSTVAIAGYKEVSGRYGRRLRAAELHDLALVLRRHLMRTEDPVAEFVAEPAPAIRKTDARHTAPDEGELPDVRLGS